MNDFSMIYLLETDFSNQELIITNNFVVDTIINCFFYSKIIYPV